MFQPCKVTASDLISETMLNTLLCPHLPPLSLSFLDLSCFHPMSYSLPISRCLSLHHLSVTPAPHIISRNRALFTWTLPTPITHHILSLISEPSTVCLRLMPFLCPLSLPLPPLACTQVPVFPLGLPNRGSLHASVHSVYYNHSLLQFTTCVALCHTEANAKYLFIYL